MNTKFLNKNEGVPQQTMFGWKTVLNAEWPEEHEKFLHETNGARIERGWGIVIQDPILGQPVLIRVTKLYSIEQIIATIKVMRKRLKKQKPQHLFVDFADLEDHDILVFRENHVVHENTMGFLLTWYLPIGETTIGKLMIGYKEDERDKIILLTTNAIDEKQVIKKIHLAYSFDEFLAKFKKGKTSVTTLGKYVGKTRKRSSTNSAEV